jgi:hypothetical protein
MAAIEPGDEKDVGSSEGSDSGAQSGAESEGHGILEAKDQAFSVDWYEACSAMGFGVTSPVTDLFYHSVIIG